MIFILDNLSIHVEVLLLEAASSFSFVFLTV
jgi:hypothetical protein